MPHETKMVELVVVEPLGCHLQAIGSVGGAFNWGNGASFDALLERGHNQGDGYKGAYFTGTIVSVRFDPKTDEELRKRGFKILGILPGAHQSPSNLYKMYLYGKGFEEQPVVSKGELDVH